MGRFAPASRHSFAARYGFAVIVTALAVLVRVGLTPVWGLDVPLITFYPAIMASAWFGGFGPGLTTTLLSALTAHYLWMGPQSSVRMTQPGVIVALGVFVAVGVFISVLTEALYRTSSRLAANEARRASETRFRNFLESAPDAIVIIDRGGRIVLVNAQTERLFGYRREELSGQPVELLMPERYRGRHADLRVAFSADPRTRAMGTGLKLFGQRKDGSEFPVEISLSPLETEEGPLVASAIRDVTEREEAERLRARHAELEAADRAKDQFLAMLGHELRNPLAAIASATSVLSTTAQAPDPSGRPLEVIRRQTELLSRLVDDLLDVTRITAAKLLVDLAPLDLADVAEACVTTLRAAGRLEKHQLNLEVDHVWINGDRARLEQIITNLLTNAVKYTPDGGVITVRIERAGDEAVLRVKDTGAGIAPELLPRVFELFTQGQPLLERRQEGLGIGLALVRRLVELHGGQVYAYSEGVGRGSEFIVRLPLAPVAPPESHTSAPPARG
ncbi:MAG TPA: ATP-binding protein [Methylomirabilota bacterium]|nr:ATP-binding protein [Methylomirabilota bacterium]